MRCAVLGHPIAHTLSPVLHGAAHAALGLRGWRYEVHDVEAPALAGFLDGLDATWAGLSLTMPLKAAALDHLADVSDLARAVGAVNTVVPSPVARGESLTWRGENTDVHGATAALWEAGVERAQAAVVLGAGATAASVLAALTGLGVREVVVHARDPRRAEHLGDVVAVLPPAAGAPPRLRAAPWPTTAEEVAALGAADVVVSTAPAGATDVVADLVGQLAGAGSRPRAALLDVVYAPRPTRLVRAWAAAGATAVDGSLMLLHQAGEQVRLMTGRPAPLEAMRAGLEDALAQR